MEVNYFYYLKVPKNIEVKDTVVDTTIHNVKVKFESGQLCWATRDSEAEVPIEISRFVSQVKIRHNRPVENIDRRAGKYLHGNAVGLVEKFNRNSPGCKVTVHGPNKAEAVDLWQLILAGKVSPEFDYEAPQVESLISEDKLLEMKKNAANMAMSLLEQAMSDLSNKIK